MKSNQTSDKIHSSQELQKSIKARHFFSLAFGCAIGVGWILVLGEWLNMAGPLGSILAFAFGAVVMIFVGLCYAEMASMLPVCGGEVVYNYEVFGLKTSFAIGWALAFAWIVVTAFEVISVGWILGTIFPSLKGEVLYTVNGDPVYLGGLIIGISGGIVITFLNYKGLKSAATFQEILTYTLLVLSSIFIIAGIVGGKVNNLEPLFSNTETTTIFGGIFSVFLIVPFFFAGFNIIPQTIEEKAPGTSVRTVVSMIILSIALAGIFYILVILSSSMAIPWQSLLSLELPTAGAFEAAFNSPLMAKVVLFAGLCGLITSWNTGIIFCSRIMFSLGRARIIPHTFSKIHPIFGSPFVAVIFVGVIGTSGVFFGRSAIIPFTNVGGTSFGLAFLFTCLGAIRMRRVRTKKDRPYSMPGGIMTAIFGALFSLFIIFLSLYLPYTNSTNLVPIEWIFIIFWVVLGILFWRIARKIRNQINETERRKLILGSFATRLEPNNREEQENNCNRKI